MEVKVKSVWWWLNDTVLVTKSCACIFKFSQIIVSADKVNEIVALSILRHDSVQCLSNFHMTILFV